VSDELAALRAEVARLAAAVDSLTGDREHYRELYLQALERCRKLELGLLGSKAEKLAPNDAQLAMPMLELLLGRAPTPDPPPKQQRVREHNRNSSTGRKPLPAQLPRVEIELLPPEVERDGRDAFEQIGEDTSETIERRPASVVIVLVRRPKFVRKDRERNAETTVVVAPTPELPIERGLAGPGFLADTVVRRWQDHQPLHRLEEIYRRDGLDLARSTMCGWHATLAELARPWSMPCGATPAVPRTSAPTRPASWSRPRRSASAVISGWWWRRSAMCSMRTPPRTMVPRSTPCWTATRATSWPTPTPSTITCFDLARSSK
jgi:transposase